MKRRAANINDDSSKQKIKEDFVAEPAREDAFTDLICSLKPSRKIIKDILKEQIAEKEVEDEIAEVSDDSDEEQENEESEEESDEDCKSQDPFKVHFEVEMKENKLKKALPTSSKIQFGLDMMAEYWNGLDDFLLQQTGKKLLKAANIKEKVRVEWETQNKSKNNKNGSLTDTQENLFKYIASYKDVLFTQRTINNAEEIRRLYSLHAVNHVLKTRSRIVKNNAKLLAAATEKKEIDECRDQGFTRPKVIMVVPFRDSCLKIVKNVIKIALTTGTKVQVMQKKRFMQEYSVDPDEAESKGFKPADFKETFRGNTDDDFIIGLTVTKNTVKCYAKTYGADIIITSPLGLRRTVKTEGEKQDYDFLSSIEILIMDQMDVFNMQNWEHVLHFLEYMHKTPKESHDTDFSRVRMWCVDGLSKYYRQSLLFSGVQLTEIQSVFNKHCHNYNGKVRIYPKEVSGTIEQVVSQSPQIFHKVLSQSYSQSPEDRFQFFINKILPELRGQLHSSTAIFVPSYFDFVRVRNHLKKEEISFVQISEYSKRSNISRSRTLFLEKKNHFILFTERFYFFYRYRIRGIKHIVFYDLPQYPHFYPEIINFMESGENSCLVLYTRYDGYKLEAIAGKNKCKQMITSQKDTHMIVTGER